MEGVSSVNCQLFLEAVPQHKPGRSYLNFLSDAENGTKKRLVKAAECDVFSLFVNRKIVIVAKLLRNQRNFNFFFPLIFLLGIVPYSVCRYSVQCSCCYNKLQLFCGNYIFHRWRFCDHSTISYEV